MSRKAVHMEYVGAVTNNVLPGIADLRVLVGVAMIGYHCHRGVSLEGPCQGYSTVKEHIFTR